MLALAVVQVGVSAPSGTSQSDTFEHPDGARWNLVSGSLGHKTEIGRANDPLTWMVLGDDNDTSGVGASRVVANASHMTDGDPTWNTTSSAYTYSATLVQNASYAAPASTASAVTGGPSSNTTSGTGSNASGGATTQNGTIPLTISASALTSLAPTTVTFSLDSAHANASNLSWTLDVDGAGVDANGTGLPSSFSHTYASPGIYTARLQAVDGNDTGEATIEIAILREIVATISADATSGTLPATVAFDLTSAEADAATLSWTLDADGDGTIDASGTGLPDTTSFTYNTAGVHTALFTVTDGTYTSTATLTLGFTAATLDGLVGLTFGEQPGGGYYMVGFAPHRFVLGIPDSGTGGFIIEEDQPHWGAIPAKKMNMTERHKYEVVLDGTTLTVRVDNAVLGEFVLPGNAIGTFGVIAGDDMQVKVGEVHWQALDQTPPTIDLFRPAAGNVYVHDHAIPYDIATPIVAAGDLTIVADVEDDFLGVKWLELRLDGKYQSMVREPTDDNGTAFTIDTSGLSTGYHTVSVWAFDHAGNWAGKDVRFYVIGTGVDPLKTAFDTVELADTAAGDVLGPVPGL